MKFYRCINEVNPSSVVDIEPQFSETVIYQNQSTAGEQKITLSDNFHNYDIIKILCCDTGSDNAIFPSYATPDILDFVANEDSTYVNCNMINTRHHVVYRIDSDTSLSRIRGNYVYITQIIGLKCTNGAIVETKIFSRQKSDSWTEINTELNLFDFNMILSLTCTSPTNDECEINNSIFMKPCSSYYGSSDINNQLNTWRVLYYNNSTFVDLTNHSISSHLWYYVTGLKFIPTKEG